MRPTFHQPGQLRMASADRLMRRAVLLLFVLAASATVSAAPRLTTDAESIDRVADMMSRRLALMPEVAAAKFRRGEPVVDPARESAVIDRARSDARALALDPEAAAAVFAVQIRMASAVEEHWIGVWRGGSDAPPPARDLVTAIRPELDRLGIELFRALYLASPALVDIPPAELSRRLSRLLAQPGASEPQLAELVLALGKLRITGPPTWATVQRAGFLRVGTTGDYAPFSEDRDGRLEGTDIELAGQIAKAWGVTALFVKTSWPTLMGDLGKRRFDLAVSGITITPERQRAADFSSPYAFDGKVPIARREDARKYSSLDRIDQPGVRVVVNPGGTNERFAREHLKRATILLHADNRTIFDELVSSRADVMITDSVEARLQERRHPELKITVEEPFTHAAKAILLPHGSDLVGRVDAWLAAHPIR